MFYILYISVESDQKFEVVTVHSAVFVFLIISIIFVLLSMPGTALQLHLVQIESILKVLLNL